METIEDLSEAPQIFLRSQSASNKAVWLVIGGCVALAAAGFGFALALVARVDQLSLQGMTTLPALLGIGALTAAWSLGRAPEQVVVGPEGLQVEGQRGSQTYDWRQIGWAHVNTAGMSHRRQLVVCDTRGKTLVRLGDAFDNFDALVDLVQQRVAQRGDDLPQRIATRKARRSALLCLVVSVFLLAGAGFMAWMVHEEQRGTRLLNEQGVAGQARIVRRFLAPNGVTPRLEYEITAPDGRTATRNAEMLRPVWDGLEGAETVPVTYVPQEPEISRLVFGEAEGRDVTRTPAVGYGLAALLAALCVGFVIGGVLQWCGWDIKFDRKTGKLSIQRIGPGSEKGP